jgi:hypothetical protein
MAKVVVDGDLLNMRIEAIVTAIHGLADVVQITNTLVSDIATFLKEPPSDDLPNLIRTLTMGLQEVKAGIDQLPERVARAVQTGEV